MPWNPWQHAQHPKPAVLVKSKGCVDLNALLSSYVDLRWEGDFALIYNKVTSLVFMSSRGIHDLIMSMLKRPVKELKEKYPHIYETLLINVKGCQ
ncbi:hypothetical protein [Vulcanisaeta souniana]|nr:hypothetical protein [Vulcanisaeta souniana]